VESRLVPVNAILDLALADGLNPAPLAAAPSAGPSFLARWTSWTFSPNSTKQSASPPRKRVTMGTRATVMHNDDPDQKSSRP
jgi:hypothetical protein